MLQSSNLTFPSDLLAMQTRLAAGFAPDAPASLKAQEAALKWRLIAQAPSAGFVATDWTDWLTPAVTAHLLSQGSWVDLAATPVREELGIPLRCHFSVLDRWRERAGSQAYFGFGLYGYRGRSYWWLHSWLIDTDGILIDSAEGRDKNTRYFGVPWSWELLGAVNATAGHPFEDILLDGLKLETARAAPKVETLPARGRLA